jgi:hypothetical protein
LSRAAFIADQKASHRVPYAVSCRALGVSESWFFKWHDRPPTPAEQRRAEVDQAVAAAFEASKGTYGSPRIHADLVAAGGASARRRSRNRWRFGSAPCGVP